MCCFLAFNRQKNIISASFFKVNLLLVCTVYNVYVGCAARYVSGLRSVACRDDRALC